MPNGNITSDLTGSGRMTATLTVPQAGTKNYDDLINKPSINNVTLEGNLNTEDLNISYDDLNDLPTIPEPYTPISYSTTEQDTGTKWIDGKPIYQKTINIGNLPNNQSKSVAHGISNLDVIINMYGVSKNSSNSYIPLPFINTVTISSGCQLEANATNIMVRTATNLSSYSITYVTLFYTKTTD